MKVLGAVFLLILSFNARAQGDLGIGVSLGNPTGLNGKYWLTENSAVDGGAAFSFGKHTDFNLHSDYLLHEKSALFLNEVNPLDVYYGIGARMEFADDIELGIRFPLGVAHVFGEESSDVFAEIAPVLDFLNTTAVELYFAIGARYYFNP
ncbi:MAG TPA: hypothetical protein VNJ01_04795 [Bacteriovoracaceae bacterium]|nr:hypothetical protein [Bacteriovoracaceae bacterium]